MRDGEEVAGSQYLPWNSLHIYRTHWRGLKDAQFHLKVSTGNVSAIYIFIFGSNVSNQQVFTEKFKFLNLNLYLPFPHNSPSTLPVLTLSPKLPKTFNLSNFA